MFIVTITVLRLTNVLSFVVLDNETMSPKYNRNDLMVGSGIKNNLKRGDVVVIQPYSNVFYIERIVGLPGEHVILQNGYIYIGGTVVVEDYLDGNHNIESGQMKYEFILGDNEYLVCVDNRDGYKESSYDGRNYGPISKDMIYQHILFKITTLPENFVYWMFYN